MTNKTTVGVSSSAIQAFGECRGLIVRRRGRSVCLPRPRQESRGLVATGIIFSTSILKSLVIFPRLLAPIFFEVFALLVIFRRQILNHSTHETWLGVKDSCVALIRYSERSLPCHRCHCILLYNNSQNFTMQFC